MEHLWAPWRIGYIKMERPKGCIFCDKPKENQDAKNYVLYRGKLNFVILNSFPYNPGHLMIVPFKHTGNIEALTDAELHEHIEIIRKCVAVLKQTFNTDSFNIGSNLGKVAGAGIDDHFHSHIVPRWLGDTNYMTVVADIRVIPDAMAEVYKRLKDKF